MKARFVWPALVAAAIVIGVGAWRFRAPDLPQSEDPDQNIQWLAAGTPEKQVDRAHASLFAAGTAAFPALIKHLENKIPADRRFQRAVVTVAPDGSRRDYTPTIGDVCYDILELQIQGRWPKSLILYRGIDPQWLREHMGSSLAELQEMKLSEALRRAKAEGDQQAVQFFEERRSELRR